MILANPSDEGGGKEGDPAKGAREQAHTTVGEKYERGKWAGTVGRVGRKYIYIRCIYGIFGRGITKYTVYIYGSGQPYTYGSAPTLTYHTVSSPAPYMHPTFMVHTYVGLARTIYIRCIYGMFGWEITIYIRSCTVYIYAILANPTHSSKNKVPALNFGRSLHQRYQILNTPRIHECEWWSRGSNFDRISIVPGLVHLVPYTICELSLIHRGLINFPCHTLFVNWI